LQLLFENNISIFSENLNTTIMKTFKLIDFWVSAGLIIVFTVLSLFKQDDTFMVGYFVVGGWQVISMLVHVFTNTFTHGARSVYHWITLITVFTMPIGSIWILLFAAPFMAVYYTWICYNEVYIKMRRPLSVLK
jgi:hypothetical protein